MGTRAVAADAPPSLPLWLGILVAAALIAVQTLVVSPRAGDEHRAARP
jgi:hypothetical protein